MRRFLPVLLLLFFGQCNNPRIEPPSNQRNPPAVAFSPSWEAPLDYAVMVDPVVLRINTDLVAVARTREGNVQSISKDNGRTWSPPVFLNLSNRPLTPVSYRGQSLWYISSEQVTDGGQFYLHVPKTIGWYEPSPIRDTFWGRSGFSALAFDEIGGVYAVFIDYREGNPDIYFTSSVDSGKTWSSNVRINDDKTGQEQFDAVIGLSERGTLCVLWSDNRGARTLFDIYSSVSTDKGKTWSRNVRVNDDTSYAWQRVPSIAYLGNTLGAAWMDYREKADDGERRANIYFSYSTDEGRTWAQNVRLRESGPGQSTYPALSKIGDRSFGCLWSDTRENILGDILYSYSTDEGRSWSTPVRVNDDTIPASHYHRSIGWLGAGEDGGQVVGWLGPSEKDEKVVGWTDLRRVRLSTLDTLAVIQPRARLDRPLAQKAPTPLPFSYIAKELLVSDDPKGKSTRWEVLSGTWVVKDSMRVGYGSRNACLLIGDDSWNDYELSGRFKLDDFDHRVAHIYIRVSNHRPPRYYRIVNLFRRGITLEYFDGNKFSLLEKVSYPIRKEPWYKFRAVVRGNAINYFLDDTLRIASDRIVHRQHGKTGIGSETVPAYFRDIKVSKVE